MIGLRCGGWGVVVVVWGDSGVGWVWVCGVWDSRSNIQFCTRFELSTSFNYVGSIVLVFETI